MKFRRSFDSSECGAAKALFWLGLVAAACSAPPGYGDELDDEMPEYSGRPGAAGSGGQTGSVGGSAGAGQSSAGTNSLPLGGSGSGVGGSGTPVGNGGSGSVNPPGGAGGQTSAGGTAGASAGGAGGSIAAGGSAGAGSGGTGQLPEPPGEAFFFDDFESGAPGTQPASWDSWINYSNQAGNTADGAQFALLDNTDRFRGNQSIHFHAEGATQPAMLTFPLPEGLTRVYVRAFVKTTKQIGNQTPDQVSNHETLIGLRATPNDGNFEIRFGGAKGALGFNIVGPGRNDAVAPGQSLWGSAPAITPNEWHCVELAFLNDNAQSPQARASVDGQEVRAVTQLGDWHVPLSGEGTTWLNGMFKEVILGWQSFSPAPGNDVWMDDIVLSESPVGCN
jgi:hypothetical protein